MAEESYFDRFFNRENNQGLYNLGDTLSELPAKALDSFKRDKETISRFRENQDDYGFNNLANDAIEKFMASEAETQGGQAFRKGLEFFRGLGETGIDYASVPFEKAQEGIKFLQSDSDFVLAEKERAKQIENQRLIELDPLGEFSGMGPQIIPDFESPNFESLNIDPDILSGLDVEVDADNAVAARLKEKALAEKKAQDAADSTIRMSQQGPNFVPVAEDEKSSKEDKIKNTESAYVSAMKDYLGSLDSPVDPSKGETKAEALARYNKEFTDATGIDASGKPDKSRALMAFGLALMNNKGGNILKELGDAGQKALPFLSKAVDDAKAAQVAAGKYALGQVKAGESATAAFAKEAREGKQAFLLSIMEHEREIELKELDIKAEDAKDKLKLYNLRPIKIGGTELEIGYGSTKDQLTKFTQPSADANNVISLYSAYDRGQGLLDLMETSLTEIANDQSGSAYRLSMEKLQTLGVKLGIKDAEKVFGVSKTSEGEKFEVNRQAMINAFKKAILQESQISNLDLTTLFDSFGSVDIFSSPQKSLKALESIKGYFASKKSLLETPLKQFTDQTMYQNQDEFNRVQTLLKTIGLSGGASANVNGQSSMTGGTDGNPLAVDLTN